MVIDGQTITATTTVAIKGIPATLYESATDSTKYLTTQVGAAEYVAAHAGIALTSSQKEALKGTGTTNTVITIGTETFTFLRK